MLFNKLARNILVAVSVAIASATYAADPAPAAAASPPTPAAAAELTPEAKAEADAVSHLEKKFHEAARGYRKVEKNGETLYCKKEKPINSTIPRLQCISEAQLRLQVEQMDQLRDRMRNSARCTHGVSCGSGG